jgi:hypothetical protein
VHANNKSSKVLANYVAKLFDDMWFHSPGLTPTTARDSKLHYIVGSSTFQGTLVSTEAYYTQMMLAPGFDEVEYVPVRKRNSKSELVEFDVRAVRHRHSIGFR